MSVSLSLILYLPSSPHQLYSHTPISSPISHHTMPGILFVTLHQIITLTPCTQSCLFVFYLTPFSPLPHYATPQVNLELLGDKYVKAVTESMMPTGVITEEYLDGLDRLRIRLGKYEGAFLI